MFLLTLALTLFTLMEFVVRRQLKVSQQFLSGLYSGNPKRKTNRPTAEKLLTAFEDLTLYLYPDGSTEISSLNSLQKQILLLMKIPESIYFVPQLVPNWLQSLKQLLLFDYIVFIFSTIWKSTEPWVEKQG